MVTGLDDNLAELRRAVPCRLATAVAVATLWLLLSAGVVIGQGPPVHYFQRSDLMPGVVGQGQLYRGGPLAGYVQPVEIRGPQGSSLAMAVDGRFEVPQRSPIRVGLLIGYAYRIKVTRIPRAEGAEVFPTIELVNRLYPPPRLKNHFPIPIELTAEELEMALSGQLVTRVIYLENPQNALPLPEDPNRQTFQDVFADEDPLQVADRMGRPVAILRMGSRIPDIDGASGRFVFASPPFTRLPLAPPVPEAHSGLEDPSEIPGAAGPIPRVPLTDTPRTSLLPSPYLTR